MLINEDNKLNNREIHLIVENKYNNDKNEFINFLNVELSKKDAIKLKKNSTMEECYESYIKYIKI